MINKTNTKEKAKQAVDAAYNKQMGDEGYGNASGHPEAKNRGTAVGPPKTDMSPPPAASEGGHKSGKKKY